MDGTSLYHCPRWIELPKLSLYMDQVLLLLEDILAPLNEYMDTSVTSTMINNYVKQRLIDRPENKKYSREHIARLIMIILLKHELSMDELTYLLERLELARSIDQVYDMFCDELECQLHCALSQRFSGQIALSEDNTHAALQSVLISLGAKLLMLQLLSGDKQEAKQPR